MCPLRLSEHSSWPPPSPLWGLSALPAASPGGASDDGFSAIKLTALGRPQFLVSAGTFHVQRELAGTAGYREHSVESSCASTLGLGARYPGGVGGGPWGCVRVLGAGSRACTRGSSSGLHLQLQFSDVLTKWRRFFHQMAAEQGKAGLDAMDTKLEVVALQVGSPPCWCERMEGYCGAGAGPCQEKPARPCLRWVPRAAPGPAAPPETARVWWGRNQTGGSVTLDRRAEGWACR